MTSLIQFTFAFLSAGRHSGLVAALLLASGSPVAAQIMTGTNPVKIFILAGESNMHGKGTVSPSTKQGTLDYITSPANDPTGKYQFLKSGGSYVTRADVGMRSFPYLSGDKIGNLTINYGGNADGLIGPELGFGHVVGDAYENKVLIVKVGVDATTLGGSFCPPSSRVGEPEPVTAADKGYYYQQILRRVNEAKSFLGTTPYEIVGLGWHQGYNDRVQPALSDAYETNMVNFINDIRSSDKGIGVPNLPIVIATVGIDGLALYPEVERAQLKMADSVAYPTFAGNVAVVDTRQNYEELEFWQTPSQSPANEGYHWNRNGKSYLHVGMAMGDAMLRMAPGRIPYRIGSSGSPAGTTLTWKNGTEMPASVRVLRDGVEIAASVPANPPVFVDPNPPLGISTYELQFTMPGAPAPSLSIGHNSGVTNLVARLRVNGANLFWKNNATYAGLTVKRGGVVIATLPGSDTSYIDPAPPAGTLSYTVEPTTPGSIPAQASLRVSAHPAQTAVIYEPFDMTADTLLQGKKGGLGLDGDWSGSGTLGITASSLTYGSLPTYGNRLLRGGGNGSASIPIGTTLADAGLLADGAVLWFSFLHQEPNNTNCQPAFLLGNSTLDGYYNEIATGGSGIGLRLGSGKNPQPILFNAGAYSQGTVQGTLATSQNALIVGKITWGANPSAPDTIQIYTPGSDLVLDIPTSLSAVLDQSGFSMLSMWGNVSAPEFDEIRFGATYQDVTGQGVDTSNDTNPPPAPSFATPPTATSATSITMTATVVTDPEGGAVEYFFDETSGNPGATDSGWQSSPTYTDSGLNPNTQYTYTVRARDSASPPNESVASGPASATTQSAVVPGGAIIHEPFDMTAGALAGKAGGTGLGTWNRHSGTAGSNEIITAADGMTYGSLPATGLRIKNQTTGGTRANNVSIGASLSGAGLLADGATLWFSVLVQPVTSSNSTSGFALCSGNITYYDTTGVNGVGINIQNGSDLEYCVWKSGSTYQRSVAQGDLHNVGGTGLGYRPHLVVGKITWGTGGGNDTFELFMPNTSLTQGSRKGTTQSINVDQSTFNRICIYNQGGGIEFDEIRFGASYEAVIGQGSSGPGPLDHFAISAIPSPQTVGTPITGITLTAQDAANQTVTGFTGTVNFGGSGGFSGTSANFMDGVLSGISATPTTAGSNLTFTVTDPVSGKTGTTTIATIQTQYAAWSRGASFNEDANGDGVKNGLAWVFGAKDKNTSALGLLPTFDNTSEPDYFIFTYRRLDTAVSAGTGIAVHYGSDLAGWTTATHDGTNIIINPTNDFYGTSPGIDKVEVRIKKTLAVGDKVFARLEATL